MTPTPAAAAAPAAGHTAVRTGAERAAWWALHDPRLTVIIASLLLSAWTWLTQDVINADGVLYLDTARHLAAGAWAQAHGLYPWLGYPALIAAVHGLTGLGFEAGAQLVQACAYAGLALAFVAFVQQLSPVPGIGWLAAAVILLHPYLNESRAEIVRDPAYWALWLCGLLTFLRLYRSPCWRTALACGMTFMLAAMLRIEALVTTILLPVVLLWLPGPARQRARVLGYAYAGLLPTVLLMLAASALATRYGLSPWREAETLLAAGWSSLQGGLIAKAGVLEHQFLNSYSDDYLLGAVLLTLAWIALHKTATVLGPLYTVLPWFARLRQRAMWQSPALRLLLWAGLVQCLILIVVLMARFFLTRRFVVPLSLCVLAAMPALLLALWQRWREPLSPLRRLVLGAAVALSVLYMLIDGLVPTGDSKAYLRQAGHSLRELPPEVRIASSERRVLYYAGRLDSGTLLDQPALLALLRNAGAPAPAPAPDYDYLALEFRDHADSPVPAPGWRRTARFPATGADGVVVYERTPPAARQPGA